MIVFGIIIGLLFVLGSVFALAKPQYALVYIIALFPAKQLMVASLSFFQTYGPLINVAAALVVGAAITSSMLRRIEVFKGLGQAATYALIVLYGQVAVGILYSPAKDAAFSMLGESWPYLLLMLIGMPLLVSRLDEFRRIIPATLVVGSIIMFLLLIHPAGATISNRFVLIIGHDAIGGAQQGNPLATAELGGMLVVIAMLYRPAERSQAVLLLRIAAIVLGLLVGLVSGSRGQVLFAVLIGVFFLPVATPMRSVGAFLGSVVLVLFLGGVGYFALQTFVAKDTAGRFSAGGLTYGLDDRMRFAWTMVEAYGGSPMNWVTGLGTSAFNAYVKFKGGYSYPHNLLVEVVTEYGLLGLTLLMVHIWAVIGWGRKLVTLYSEDRAMRSAAAVLCAITAYVFLLSLKQGSLTSLPTQFAWGLVLAKIGKFEWDAAVEYSLHASESESEVDHEHEAGIAAA